MRGSLRTPALIFALAGLIGFARSSMDFFEPAYYSPSSPLDYSAAWLTSLFVGLIAIGLALWAHRSPIRRGSWMLAIAALAFLTAGVGNVLEDVYRMKVGGDLFFAGFIVFPALLIAGAATLTVKHRLRWSGLLFLALAVGVSNPDVGGWWLAAASLIAAAYWINSQPPPGTPGQATIT